MKKKTCPRCQFKMPEEMTVCGACGLNFYKLEGATNKEAREAIRAKEYDRVVYTKDLPADLKKWPLFCWALFLGIFGVHMFKVGKYLRGLVYLVFNVIGLTILSLSLANTDFFRGDFLYNFYYIGGLCFAVCLLFVAADTVKIAFNRFSVPVALPYKD